MKSLMAFFCFTFFLLVSLWAFWSCDNPDQKSTQQKVASDLKTAERLINRGRYDSAIIYFGKSADYNLELQQYPIWAKSVAGIIDCFRSKGDMNEAMQIVDQALIVASTRVDTTGNIYNGLIHKKALLYSDSRQIEKARALFTRNIAIYLSKPALPDTGLALSYNGMGTLYLLQNKFPEAIEKYGLALQIYEACKHTKSPDYASTIQNIGIVHSITGNYDKAEKYFSQSVQVYHEVLSPDNPKLASLYINMGRLYQLVRNDAKAQDYLNRAENFYVRQNQSNSLTAAALFLNMAGFYIYTADYEKAQSYLNKSLEIISIKAPRDLPDLLTIYLNMGFVAEKKRDYPLAKEYYLKGLSIGDTLPNAVKILRGLANVSYKLSDKSGANAYYKKALIKSLKMNPEKDPERALTYLRYGDFLSVTGNSQALFYLNKSLELYKDAFGPVNIDVSTAYYYIGSYYYRAKNYDKALYYFQNSLIAGFPGFTSENIADNPEISKANLNENLLNPFTAKATALLLLYQTDTMNVENLKRSTASFSHCLQMIEMLRSTYQNEDSKLLISENEKNTFANALLTQIKLYKRTNSPEALEQAFLLSEKGKSAVLLSHLRDKEAKNIGRLPEALLVKDLNLKSKIYSYNKQIHDQKLLSKPDEKKIKIWNNLIFDLSRQQDEFITSIEKDFPVYYNLKYDNSVISIGEIQKKLTSTQAIVEFTLSNSVLYTFAITSGKKQLLTTAIDSSFFKNLQKLREQLTGKHFNNYSAYDFTEFVKASHELYRTLLLPVLPIVKGKELIIVPDGELGYLSFDVLLTSMPDTTKPAYGKLPYLIRESALCYAPSATTFFDELNVKSSTNNGRILAFGPDYGPENAVFDQKDVNGKLSRNALSNLNNSQDEIRTLTDYFKVKSFIGKNATETAFKKDASNYRVLHLAMHTIINNENPLYSKMIFFKPKNDTVDDGMLNASELINMELHADMAVLSACNTGSGKMRKGEGIMSLSRDFFYAGVPGIIMTAWAVEDRSGVKLMDYFYKYVAQGKPRNEALQLAKIEYLDNCDKLTSHPHYWASYMNVGDISPLEGFGKKPNPVLIYSVALLLLVLALAMLVYLVKKQNSTKPLS